ncbi:hypothetical protein CPB83DRAFT_880369 [Crepidotus variabilis]|uniref:RGS domain-containing protein n=1 Tax=Crepidotus variabilis TaxID=179855 RepID=A0A9P6EQX7_9AGAR|nr:hypothetical protein CPB83DRAFT_880369 [Crepidotus variabilis]
MAARQPQKFSYAQPRSYTVSIKNVLTFPFRMCNPPPAIGKVRSCGVTPLYKVRLNDVLNREHLPPLGLKDFEEWLLFVELSPENLYFILWLREYRQRYEQWKSEVEFKAKKAPSAFPINWSAQFSTHLGMFYQRAKQTFFTPGSEYELNLSSSLLAPFHQENSAPYPDPQIFVPVEIETRRMLDESLRRFVAAQFNNVGNKRVLCGLVAGIIFVLLGTIPALSLSFTLAQSRWPRLAAFPGLWLGLTIIISSLNGICLGVYLFGDLRQLRKFELARPMISKPQPLPTDAYRFPSTPRPESANSILPMQQAHSSRLRPSSPGPGGLFNHRAFRSPSMTSGLTDYSVQTASSSTSDANGIQISPAYYDADEIDTSAMYEDNVSDDHFPNSGAKGGYVFNRDAQGNALANEEEIGSEYLSSTATFIHPWEFADEHEEEVAVKYPYRHQKVDTFDFDSLPKRLPVEKTSQSRVRSTDFRTSVPIIHEPQPARSTSRHSGITHMASYPAVPSSLSYTSLSPSPISPTGTTFNDPLIYPHTSIPSPVHALPNNHQLKLKLPDPRTAPPSQRPTSFLARFQERCGIARWRLQPGFLESAQPFSDNERSNNDHEIPPLSSSSYWLESPHARGAPASGIEKGRSARVRAGDDRATGWLPSRASSSASTTTAGLSFSRSSSLSDETSRAEKAKKRFKMISAVPPFAVPLTKILSPVIARGQWEIVVRSAAISFLVAWVVVGGLLAVPAMGS